MKGANNIKTIFIAGAGIMGASIAQVFASCEYTVVIFDISEESIQKGKELIKINQRTYIDSGKFTEEQSSGIIDRIFFSLDIEDFRKADFVVECIAENLEVKREFWAKVSQISPPEIVLASNTSGLSITKIAESVMHPERFAGMHWVNPPHIIPLVEVIAGEKTSPETVGIVYDLARSTHHKPVKVKKDAPGFILNRLQYAVLREALYIVESDIASMEDVDNVMKYGLGMRYSCIGPFETVDLGGLDTFFKVGSYLFPELSAATEVPKLLADCYRDGHYGVKTGNGFYNYDDGNGEAAIKKRDNAFIKLSECLYSDL